MWLLLQLTALSEYHIQELGSRRHFRAVGLAYAQKVSIVSLLETTASLGTTAPLLYKDFVYNSRMVLGVC